MGKKGKKVVLRDYGNYLSKNEVKAERTEKPLMNIVVFLCVVISFICMVAFPLVKVLVWSNELGIYPQSRVYVFAELFCHAFSCRDRRKQYRYRVGGRLQRNT